MKALIPWTLAIVLAVTGSSAQDGDGERAAAVLGGDRYMAARDVAADEPTEGDLFIAGEHVGIDAAVGGSVHAAGRKITLEAPVEGSVYAFGYAVNATAPIAGNVSVSGAEVRLEGDIGGNLRAAGSELTLSADVQGTALLAGGEVFVDGAVAGDLVVATDDLAFGDAAEVGGRVTVYTEDPDEVTVPARVAGEDRVSVRDAREFDRDSRRSGDGWGPGPGTTLFGLLMGVLTVAAIAALFVFLAPQHLAAIRRHALAWPGRSVLVGFLGMSTLAGMGIVLTLTVIGLLLVPASILLAGLAALIGYALGSYILGVGLWMGVGKPEPATPLQKVGLAALGAVVSAVLVLVPFLGWLFLLALTFLGLGASLRLMLRPPEAT